MKSGWVTKKLGEVCESVHRGKSPVYCDKSPYPMFAQKCNQPEYITLEKCKFCEPSKYLKFPSKFRLRENDIVINSTGTGTLGRVGLFHLDYLKPYGYESIVADSHVMIVRTSKDIVTEYLYLYLKQGWVYKWINENANGSTNQKELYPETLCNLDVPIPPLAEQKRIVAKIDAAFEKIDALKANAEKNLANAKELFQSALDEAMRPKKGWVEKRLGEVCAITSVMVDPTLPQFTNMLHVGGGNIVSDTGELIDLKSAKEEKLKSGKYTFNKSMVLYNKIRPYLKKVARPHFSGLCSADMYPLLPNDSITRDFLYYILLTSQFTTYAIGESERAGMPKVNREELFAYRVKIPGTQDEQNAIAEKMDGVRKSLKTLQQNYARQIADCAEMRQAILREAFEGRL